MKSHGSQTVAKQWTQQITLTNLSHARVHLYLPDERTRRILLYTRPWWDIMHSKIVPYSHAAASKTMCKRKRENGEGRWFSNLLVVDCKVDHWSPPSFWGSGCLALSNMIPSTIPTHTHTHLLLISCWYSLDKFKKQNFKAILWIQYWFPQLSCWRTDLLDTQVKTGLFCFDVFKRYLVW